MGAIQSYQQSEQARIVARSEFDVFDRSQDPALDELSELAAVLSLADYAYIGWLDYNRLWFKSRFGFHAAEQVRAQTACQWIGVTGQSLLVKDAAEDPRFLPTGIEVPGGKHCRSYAGVPLFIGNRELVGTFAVLSRKPN